MLQLIARQEYADWIGYRIELKHGISRQSVAPQKAKVRYLTWQRQFRVHESLQSEQHPVERLLCQLTNWPIARVRAFGFRLGRMLRNLPQQVMMLAR